MQPHQIPQADLLDILFEGRNKNYGAYDLRKNYNRRLRTAILFTLGLCLLLTFGYVLAGKTKTVMATRPIFISDTISLADVSKHRQIVVPPPAHRALPQPVAMLNVSRPLIVPDDQVRPEDRTHTVEEMSEARLGTVNRIGKPDDNMGGPVGSPNGIGTGVIAAPTQNSDGADTTFRAVEIESSYKGGAAAWLRFLQRNFHPSEEAVTNGIQGTVIVQFIVDKAGNVSDVQALSGPEEYQKEAVRVIKKSGQWEPAIQNGRHVASYKKQPIVVLMGSND